MLVIKRDGSKVDYNRNRIIEAVNKAFMQANGEVNENNAFAIANLIETKFSGESEVSVETIQDEVIQAIKNYSPLAADLYSKYRNKHTKLRDYHNEKFVERKENFIREYMQSKNAASGSKYDANANVTNKNIATMSAELNKYENIQVNRHLVYKKITELYGEELADEYIRMLESHELYCHDETSIYPYCVSISMYPFLFNGLTTLGGESQAPTHISSFCGSFCNLVFAISAQFAGAVATVEFLMYMDYFIRKEYGDNYYTHPQAKTSLIGRQYTVEEKIEGYLQQVVYTINQPAAARGYQSCFWNISIFDKPYFESIFGEFKFPDGTSPQWESLDWLQRKFLKWFNKERTKSILTFPVVTMALLTDKEKPIYEPYYDLCAEELSQGQSFFIYMSDSADSLASCCFDGQQKVLIKNSKNGVHLMAIEDFVNGKYTGLKENFKVFHNGNWVSANTVKTIPTKDMYKITTANKKELFITANHLNPTLRGDVRADELTSDDYLMFNTLSCETAPEKDLGLTYEQGYLIGLYLGDGSKYKRENTESYSTTLSLNECKYEKSLSKLNKAIKDLEINKEFKVYDNVNNCLTLTMTSKKLFDFISTWVFGSYANEKELNLNCILQSIDFRKGILDGMYDSDGGNSNRIYSTSAKLIEELEALMTSLGLVSVIDMNDRTNEKVVIRDEEFNRNYPLYCIRWYTPRHKRSMENIYKIKNNSIFFKIANIKKIENYDKANVYCFEMKDKEEPYFTLPNGVITHNCRLRNELVDNTFSYSLGAGGVSTGSINVMTLNINRLVQQHKDIRTEVKKVQKFQIAYRKIMEEFYKGGLLPVYNAGYISLEKQFLTIGINGMVEAAESQGIEAKPTAEYQKFVESILAPIYEENKRIRKETGYMFNTEFVPAENLGSKNLKWDLADGLKVKDGRECYNSYFYAVEDEDINPIDKFTLHGRDFVSKLDGGSALHLNLAEHLSKEQYKKLIKIAAQRGCNYWTVNVKNTVCNKCGYISKHTLDKCPKCGSTDIDYATRVIGYLKRVSKFSQARQNEEKKRAYSKLC